MGGRVMDVKTFVDLVNNVGVPVAVIIGLGVVLFWLIKYNMTSTDKVLEANKTNSDTIAKANEVIEKATETNRLLVDKIEGEITDLKSGIDKIITKLDS